MTPAGGANTFSGTLAGVVPTEEMVAAFVKVAGRISTQLCGGSTLDTIKATIRQASDIPLDLNNVAGVPCDGISFAITFTGTVVSMAAIVTPGPDPCTGADGG